MAKIWRIFYLDAFEKEKERFYLVSLPEEGWFNRVCLMMRQC